MDSSNGSSAEGIKIHPALQPDVYETFVTYCAWKGISQAKAANRMLRFFFKNMSKKDKTEMLAFYSGRGNESEDDEPLEPLSKSKAA